MLAAASVAAAATLATGHYHGHTGQTDPRPHHHNLPLGISFRVDTAGDVVGLRFDIIDRCPDGHILMVHSYGYPPMPVTASRFGGTFDVVRGHRGEGSTVAGRISGTSARGSLTDTGWSGREHALCRGKTRFTASSK